MARADDKAILDWARTSNRVVVTLDADFHALLALSGATAPSVIRLRAEGLRAAEAAAVIEATIRNCGEELAAGAVVSTDGQRARVRRLPIG
jgi:predicted nuclease of predicted toxin-antitoxin system